MIHYTNSAEASFVRLCIPTESKSGIELVVNRWEGVIRPTLVRIGAEQRAPLSERHALWRRLLAALCDFATPGEPTVAGADKVIDRAEYLGDRWRAFGMTHEAVVEQMRLMHVVLHDAFGSWTYEDGWLSRFESAYTVATLAVVLGFASEQLINAGRFDELAEARRHDWRRWLKAR